MRAQGLRTTGWMHRLVGRAHSGAGWYRQLRDGWAARQAARRAAHLAALSTCWNAAREAFTPLRAEAAMDMAMAQGVLSSVAIQPYAFAF
jgi:hypothetical protein